MPTYIRLLDTFPENHKVVGLSDGAFRLYVNMLCYCSRNRTDGRVPRGMVKHLRGSMARVQELHDARLLDAPVDFSDFDGFVVHDYLDHQRSRAEIDELSEKRRESGKQGGRPKANGKQTESKPKAPLQKPENPETTTTTTTEADPEAKALPPSGGNKDAVVACVRALDNLTGRLNGTPTVQRQIQDWLEGFDVVGADAVAWFEKACDQASLQDVRKLAYVMAILGRWQREGGMSDRRENGSGERTPAFVSGLGARIAGVGDFDFGPPENVAPARVETVGADGAAGDSTRREGAD